VALTGSDTASNILFGNLQKITSEQLGLSPILMAAAKLVGRRDGKMTTRNRSWSPPPRPTVRPRGTILRYVFNAFDRAGVPGRPVRDPAGLCLSVHRDGPEIDPARAMIGIPRAQARGDLLVRGVSPAAKLAKRSHVQYKAAVRS